MSFKPIVYLNKRNKNLLLAGFLSFVMVYTPSFAYVVIKSSAPPPPPPQVVIVLPGAASEFCNTIPYGTGTTTSCSGSGTFSYFDPGSHAQLYGQVKISNVFSSANDFCANIKSNIKYFAASAQGKVLEMYANTLVVVSLKWQSGTFLAYSGISFNGKMYRCKPDGTAYGY